MEVGKTYRLKYNAYPNLTYLGYNFSVDGMWHQFSKVGETKVWSELKPSDLHMVVPATQSKEEGR
jgi:hypothetical protein